MYDQPPSRFQFNNPIWHDFNACFRLSIPAENKEWLFDESSLTARLIKASNGAFSVNLLRQRWGRMSQSECQLLGKSPRLQCLIREVLLQCNGEPWVYARSIIPVSSLSGPIRHLRHLDTRPLGQLLFNTSNMRRSPFQVSQFSSQQLFTQLNSNFGGPSATQLDSQSDSTLWGRRSRFIIYNKPLIVSEIFLPSFQSKSFQ